MTSSRLFPNFLIQNEYHSGLTKMNDWICFIGGLTHTPVVSNLPVADHTMTIPYATDAGPIPPACLPKYRI